MLKTPPPFSRVVKTIPIYESLYTLQGEGFHQGKATFLIRTFGCPIKCSWCDIPQAWHPHPPTPSHKIKHISPRQLLEKAQKTACEFVLITGGEPTIHDLSALTLILKNNGIHVHLETSGAFEIKGTFSWITVSPKWGKIPLEKNLKKADEIKLIIENENSIECWMDKIGKYIEPHQPIYLQPEWTQRNNPKVMQTIVRHIKNKGAPFRAGYQFHKLSNADNL
jgi:7-carboxy-7-deazaguanine synthase